MTRHAVVGLVWGDVIQPKAELVLFYKNSMVLILLHFSNKDSLLFNNEQRSKKYCRQNIRKNV